MGILAGIQIGAISFVDEGVDTVLDTLKDRVSSPRLTFGSLNSDRGIPALNPAPSFTGTDMISSPFLKSSSSSAGDQIAPVPPCAEICQRRPGAG